MNTADRRPPARVVPARGGLVHSPRRRRSGARAGAGRVPGLLTADY